MGTARFESGLGAAAALTAAVVAAGVLACAPAARADVFGPIALVSTGHLPASAYVQQAELAADATVSADGRYVAFDGSFGGKRGVFRRDLSDGEVAVVAEGDAVLPSISADGRYVSFTTTARLDEENDANEAPDVYVRDMDNPDSAPCGPEWEQNGEACAFEIASAVDGSSRGLTYQYPEELYGSELAFNQTHFGSLASGRSALSGDGREVAFITTAVSDLNGPEGPPLPRMQVLVRHLETHHTELVSTQYSGGVQTEEPLAAESSAVFVGSTREPLPFPSPYGGASISADGSTVAWMGTSIAQQAPVLAGEGLAESYTEPLWRRLGGGGSPIRRVTGGSDPLASACIASGEAAVSEPANAADPCQGPFETTGGLSNVPGLWTGGTQWDFVPQLSADGDTVAFLATARFIASGEEVKSAESSDDLYVADMREGLTRVQAVRRLTELAGGGFNDPARTRPIVDLGISADGTQVAFASERTVFPLGSPAFVSPPAPSAFLTELYDADLASNTLTRVTTGYEGQRTEGGEATGSPGFSGDGSLLVFSSAEDNLVYGDGNGALDAFAVPRLSFPSLPAPQEISSPPANPEAAPEWKLSVTAASRRDGTVVLYVLAPGTGSLAASAQSTVALSRPAVSARRGHRRRHPRTKLESVRVAARSSAANAAGLIVVPLALSKRYASLAGSGHGLSSNVSVVFSAAGHAPLRGSIHVTFRRTPAVRRHARRAGQGKR
jgi:hypothetical protein